MNDARLQSLFRRLAARRDESLVADDLAEAMTHSGYADEEGTPLDRIANSAVHADLLRAAMALSADAAMLSRDVNALRAPQRSRAPARRWLALAAGVGAAAILVANLREVSQPEMSAQPSPVAVDNDAILSASFEAASGVAAELSEAEPIFRGDFDS